MNNLLHYITAGGRSCLWPPHGARYNRPMTNSEPLTGQDWNGLLRRGVLVLLTAILYLLTLALGVLALLALVRTVEFGSALLIAQYDLVAPANARGVMTVLRNVTAIGGGLLLLAVAVFGLEYHWKHRGQGRSLRLIALTLGVELALLALERLVFYD
ncbi:MAG: hypothetical protein OXH77_00880 [Anaerolineaceae bacterium]|nr:hypothetical protein [Anaerolineaceae bacterium]